MANTKVCDRKRRVKYIVIMAVIICLVLVIVMLAIARNSHENDIHQSATTTEVKNGTKTETKTETIPYTSTTVDDANLEYGKTAVRTKGVNGVKTLTYEVTYENDKETKRALVGESVTTPPTTEVVAKGTKIIWRCVDTTSYDKNPYNDNRCTSSTEESRYVSDSQATSLDSSYTPGKKGHAYYNSR